MMPVDFADSQNSQKYKSSWALLVPKIIHTF